MRWVVNRRTDDADGEKWKSRNRGGIAFGTKLSDCSLLIPRLRDKFLSAPFAPPYLRAATGRRFYRDGKPERSPERKRFMLSLMSDVAGSEGHASTMNIQAPSTRVDTGDCMDYSDEDQDRRRRNGQIGGLRALCTTPLSLSLPPPGKKEAHIAERIRQKSSLGRFCLQGHGEICLSRIKMRIGERIE